MFKEVLILLKSVTTTDELGFEAKEFTEREVFANKKSVRQTEYYEAEKNGYKLSAMFEIKPYEYEDEEFLVYENQKFKIERTYEKNSEVMELVCSKWD